MQLMKPFQGGDYVKMGLVKIEDEDEQPIEY